MLDRVLDPCKSRAMSHALGDIGFQKKDQSDVSMRFDVSRQSVSSWAIKFAGMLKVEKRGTAKFRHKM